MSVEILMPALSPTMQSGILAKWNVAVGDEVKSGDVIAEIETDKATMEVEAVDEGVMAVILVDAGSQDVAVGTPIARLAEDGESASDVAAEPAKTTTQDKPAATPSSQAAPSKPSTPAAPTMPASPTAPAKSATSQSGAPAGRVFASPLAKRIAAERGVSLAGLTGSGPHGRIIRKDVESAPASGQPGQAGQPGHTGQAGTAAQPAPGQRAAPAAPGASTTEPNSQMRTIIAERLAHSKATAPHFYLTVDCEIDALLKARKTMNERVPEGVKISVNDLVIRAAAMALVKVPRANASWEGANTRYFAHADIAMAVAIDGGLITPVIWAAEQKGLVEISQISRDLAGRARDGKLAPEEYTGGSFTISNLGMFGVREFAAVINPPQGAILAVGAGEQRAVVKDGKLDVATVMSVTLSADHRVVDGAVGAMWLQAFKGYVEAPVTMLL